MTTDADCVHELDQIIAQRDAEFAELREMSAMRVGRVAELEARLNQNPRNSSASPSSKGLCKPPASNQARSKKKRRPGKQRRYLASIHRLGDRAGQSTQLVWSVHSGALPICLGTCGVRSS